MDDIISALVAVAGIAAEGLLLGYGTELLLRMLGIHERKGGGPG